MKDKAVALTVREPEAERVEVWLEDTQALTLGLELGTVEGLRLGSEEGVDAIVHAEGVAAIVHALGLWMGDDV